MILVIGSIINVLNVHKIPFPGQTVMPKGKNLYLGGKGANQAIAAAKLGSDVTMLGCVGNDAHGKQLMESMQHSGVNTDHILIADSTEISASYIGVSANSNNSIIVDSSVNKFVTPEYLLAHEDLFDAADYCVLQMEIPHQTVAKAITLCQLHSTKIVLNPSPLEMFNLSLLDGVDYVIPNEEEATALLFSSSFDCLTNDDYLHFMRCHAIKNLIITRGEKGVIHYNVTGKFSEHPISIQEAIDTTCAGDTFLGAFVTALDHGHDTNYAIRYANQASGLCVTHPSTQSSMPTTTEIPSIF